MRTLPSDATVTPATGPRMVGYSRGCGHRPSTSKSGTVPSSAAGQPALVPATNTTAAPRTISLFIGSLLVPKKVPLQAPRTIEYATRWRASTLQPDSIMSTPWAVPFWTLLAAGVAVGAPAEAQQSQD